MIRSSLKEAIKRTLDNHHYLGGADFVIREYEKDNEACLAVGYRERRDCSFIFQVQNRRSGLSREPFYAITMSPGHEVFEEALTVNDRSALLQELKGWQQRVHEDIGTRPRSRLFQAHIRGISRMEARLGLASKGLVAERSDDDGFLEELHHWNLALQEYIGASQASHEWVLISLLKFRVKEIEKIGEYLDVLSADFVGDAFSIHRELDKIKKETDVQIERNLVLKEKLQDGKLCLLENDVNLAIIDQFKAHSTKVEEIRKRLGLMPDDSAPSIDRAARLFDELQSFHERLRSAPDSLKSYHDDEMLKKLKRHLVEGEKFREGNNTLDIREVLEEMRKDISALQASNVFEKEKVMDAVRIGLRADLEEERKRRHSTIQFLDERIRKIETAARTLLDDLTSPDYLPELERGWRERALVSMEQKKRTLAMAIRLLKDDEEAETKLFRILTQSDTT